MTSSTSTSSSKLIVVSAPSGAGKTTLCHKLLADFPEIILSISSTTRAPRGTEKNGVEYFFLDRGHFQEMIAANGFAEWAEVHGNFYGTAKEFIDRAFAQGKSVLLDIDVQGAKSLKALYPNESVLIFIEPPSIEELERRLRGRGTESEENVQKRMKNALEEMSQAENFQHRIVNDAFERAYFQLNAIVAHHVRGIKLSRVSGEPNGG